MTDRETALLGYFFTVAADSRVRAAGWNPRLLLNAFGACFMEDSAGAIVAFIAKGKPVAQGRAGAIAHAATGNPHAGAIAGEAVGWLFDAAADFFKPKQKVKGRR